MDARVSFYAGFTHDELVQTATALEDALRIARDRARLAERRADKLHDAFVDSNGREPNALDLGEEFA